MSPDHAQVLRTAAHYLEIGQPAAAGELLDSALREHPDDASLLVMRSEAGLRALDLATAEHAARLALGATDPHLVAAASLALARTLMMTGPERLGEAIDASFEAVRRMPDRWEPHLYAARNLRRAGRFPEAVQAANTGIARAGADDGDRAQALMEYAYVMNGIPGMLMSGLAAGRDAVALQPNDAELQSKLAMLEVSSGHSGGGARGLRALAVDPSASLPLAAFELRVYTIVATCLGWFLLIAFVATLFSSSMITTFGDEPATWPRVVSGLVLAAMALVAAVQLREFRDPAVRRAAWRSSRRRAHVWIGIVTTALLVAFYGGVGVALGLIWIVVGTVLALVGWIVHRATAGAMQRRLMRTVRPDLAT